MCGITGFWSISGNPAEDLEAIAASMSRAIQHRGPDDHGVWIDQAYGLALGHRRLSILDLSAEGHQPMFSRSGRYVIVFNGEIYNFEELRSELDVPYRGHSDTEVMLAAFERWGIQKSLLRFNGMFAFAVWDRHEHALYLSRDRLGEKPLYYGWSGQTFLFGSELKALCAYPGFEGEIDRNALALFLRHNYIPAPYSIYKGISKLVPGTLMRLDADSSRSSLKPEPYWSVKQAAEHGFSDPFRGSDRDAMEQLTTIFVDSVKLRMVADVPLGAFLSGGIDSSTVVALMQAQSSRPVKTFSIGSREPAYNEAIFAREVARHLGTDHTELYVTSEEAMEVIPRLATLYDEPFADSSQIPTFLVSRLAMRQVTVSLSGDGGDELFGGYTRYSWSRQIWDSVKWAPPKARRAVGRLLQSISPAHWDLLFDTVDPLLPSRFRQSRPADKLAKLAIILKAADSPQSMYRELVSHWRDPVSVVVGATECSTILSDMDQWIQGDLADRLMFLDTVSYLPDDILAKVDRASMGVSLECRVPFLDHRVVEFAWRLPLHMKIRSGQGKWILRQILDQYVPSQLIERPKIGFAVPIDAWLRGPLRDWAEHLLEPARLNREGYLMPEPIQRAWEEHQSGRYNRADALWGVLMFEAWLEHQSSARQECANESSRHVV